MGWDGLGYMGVILSGIYFYSGMGMGVLSCMSFFLRGEGGRGRDTMAYYHIIPGCVGGYYTIPYHTISSYCSAPCSILVFISVFIFIYTLTSHLLASPTAASPLPPSPFPSPSTLLPVFAPINHLLCNPPSIAYKPTTISVQPHHHIASPSSPFVPPPPLHSHNTTTRR